MVIILNDLRCALRALFRDRNYALVSVLTIGLGIGAITAVFSIVNALLIKPLPYPNPDHLFLVAARKESGDRQLSTLTPADYLYLKQQERSFAGMAVVAFVSWNLSDEQNPERVQAARVSPGFFEMLGAKPILGRTFNPEESKSGLNRVVVLSERLWSKRFGRDTNIIGRLLHINGVRQTVIGVAPAELKFFHPRNIEGWPVGTPEPDLWNAMPEPTTQDRGNRYILILARLRQGVTSQQAKGEIGTIACEIAERHPDTHQGWSAAVLPLQDQVVSQVRLPLQVLFGLAVSVLIIACSNVANLSLARAVSRQKEFATRATLGASRLRLMQQAFTENLVVTALGGTFGLYLTYSGIKLAAFLEIENFPQFENIKLDLSVFFFCAAASVVSALLSGLAPMIKCTRFDVNTTLKQSTSGVTAGFRRERLRPVLVSGAVCLAFILLIGAAILTASFVQLRRLDLGFNPKDVTALDISLVDRKYKDMNRAISFVMQLDERLQSLPAIESSAVAHGLPFGRIYSSPFTITVEGESKKHAGDIQYVDTRYVSPRYFQTLQIPLIAGRSFNDSDSTNSRPVVLVNERFAQKYFHNQDPIGMRVNLGDGSGNPCEIVGVTGNINPLDMTARSEVFRPIFQMCPWDFSLIIRTKVDSLSMSKQVQSLIAELDPNRPFYNVRTMNEDLSDHLATRTFTTYMAGVFAATALILAAIGIYGLFEYSVRQRSREIGIRTALGAQAGHVIAMIIKEGLVLSCAGVAIGIPVALYLDRLMHPLAFNVRFASAGLYLSSALLVLIVASLASYFPAREAVRKDLLVALRNE